jgi:phosphoribosylanthranilate isomerase
VLGSLQIVRAFRLGNPADWSKVSDFLERSTALGRAPDAVLIDAYVAGQPGGTGATIENDILASMPPLPRVILAGGLNPTNVGALVSKFRPWMVDVASGVESAPGRKDPALIDAFVRAVKSADRAVTHPPGPTAIRSETDRADELVDNPNRPL